MTTEISMREGPQSGWDKRDSKGRTRGIKGRQFFLKSIIYKECIQCVRIDLGTFAAYLMRIPLQKFDRSRG